MVHREVRASLEAPDTVELRERLGFRVLLVFLGQLDKWVRLVREETPALPGSKDPLVQLVQLVSRERSGQQGSRDRLELLE